MIFFYYFFIIFFDSFRRPSLETSSTTPEVASTSDNIDESENLEVFFVFFFVL